jgi:hypothetical protein
MQQLADLLIGSMNRQKNKRTMQQLAQSYLHEYQTPFPSTAWRKSAQGLSC